LVAVLAAAACDASPGRPAALGQEVVLRVGEAVRFDEERLELCFDGVRSDSRCPAGVKCFWEGDAVVGLSARVGSAPAVAIELHTFGRGGRAATAAVGDLSIRLVGLAPQARLGGIPAEEYRLTLVVTRPADH
jgi:hypothetical protein